MLKRLIALGILAALLAAPLAGWGETVSFDTWLQYRAGITAVAGTPYVIVTDKHSDKKAVFTSEGEQLTDYLYNNLVYQNYGYLVGFDESAGVNNRGLVSVSGGKLTEPMYCTMTLFSKRWAVGYICSPATEEDHNFTRGKLFFNVDRVDLLYIPDPAAAPVVVGSLEAEAFSTAKAHGDYLAVQARDGSFLVYDKEFKAWDMAFKDLNTAVYGVVDYEIINKATGELVLDGFTEVKEQMIGGELFLIGTHYNFKGQKVSGLLDTAGNVLLPIEYFFSSVAGDYIVMSDASGKLKGLYSLSQQKYLVPCEYNNIMVGKVSADNYVHNGYVAVENGGLRGYYDVKKGELSCEIKYNTKEVTTLGCVTYWKVEDGVYMLAAADGVETEVHVDSIYSKNRGDGHVLVAQKDGWYGLIDWHGNEVLPFEHKWVISETDDSKAVIRTSTGLQIDLINYGE